MIEEKIKRLILAEYADCDEDLNNVEKAIENLKEKKFCLKRAYTPHGKILDKEKFFSDIDDMVKFLYKLKGEGFQWIQEDWLNYEYNEIRAYKWEGETDNEYKDRVMEAINKELWAMESEWEERKTTERQIKKLEEEIKKLKEKL